ncbi:hypothetical protein ACTMTI_48595 [Nonomuraea sp. H19]|uniref:hypothetical protein n=1 Tax=Nonomuraea sp. H19 TaxID=3452206 RepID=UPI003F8AE6C7
MVETISLQIVSFIGLFLLGVLLVVGIVLMAARRRDHGRAAVIGALGCVVLLLGTVFSVIQGLLLELLIPLLNLGLAHTFTSVISFGFNLIGTGMLIFAVVARRDPRQPAPPQGPGWQHPQPPFQQQPGRQGPPYPPQG